MSEVSKKFMQTSGEERIEAAKETIIVLPGLSKIYKNKEIALSSFKNL